MGKGHFVFNQNWCVCVHRMRWKFLLVKVEPKEGIMEQGAVLRGAFEVIVDGSHLRVDENQLFHICRLKALRRKRLKEDMIIFCKIMNGMDK